MFLVELPEPEASRQAEMDHRHQVDVDMRAAKVPSGMERYRNAEFMDKYPSVDCEGDIIVGGSPVRKQKFQGDNPILFEEVL